MVSFWNNNIKWLSVLLGVILGAILFSIRVWQLTGFKPEHFGLGKNTNYLVSFESHHPISASEGYFDDVKKSFRFLRKDEHEIALILGASQLYAINHYFEGDNLSVKYATDRAKDRNSHIRYLQTADGNANFHDLLILYQIFRQDGLIPDILVLAVVYDDLGESGMLAKNLVHLSKIDSIALQIAGEGLEHVQEELLKSNVSGGQALQDQNQITEIPTDQEYGKIVTGNVIRRHAISETPQEYLEEELIDNLEQYFPGYLNRGRISSEIEIFARIGKAYLAGFLRDQEEIEPQDYLSDWNLQAFHSLLKLAQHDSCKILLYRQPHRPTVGKFYHNRANYDSFFQEIKALADSSDEIDYSDFETIVPAEYWGLTNLGNPDYFHFRDEGHRLLGSSIDKAIEQLTNNQSSDAIQ